MEVRHDDIKSALRQAKILTAALRQKLAEAPLNPSEDFIEYVSDLAVMVDEKVKEVAIYDDLFVAQAKKNNTSLCMLSC